MRTTVGRYGVTGLAAAVAALNGGWTEFEKSVYS